MTRKTKRSKPWTPQQKDLWSKQVGQRLRDAIEHLYGRRQEYRFANDIGISQGSLADILNGKSTPAALTLYKMMDFSMDKNKPNVAINIIKILGGQ